MLNKFYIVLSSMFIGYYGASEYYGWELTSPHRQVVPADLRQKPGWHRSHTFYAWSSGYRGGK